MEKIIIKMIKIVLLIIILIVITISYLIFLQQKNKSGKAEEDEIYASDQDIYFRSSVEKVTSVYEFFDTERCIQKYISTLQKLNTNNDEYISLYKQEIYNMLDESYREQFDIEQKISKYSTSLKFCINNMYVIDITEEQSIYFVYGTLIHTQKEVNEYGFIVKRDMRNLLFSIYPYDYMLEKGYQEENIEMMDIAIDGDIEENGYNDYTSEAYDEEYVARYYFDLYKIELEYYPKGIYQKMDTVYREKRFTDLSEYERYVDENNSECAPSKG